MAEEKRFVLVIEGSDSQGGGSSQKAASTGSPETQDDDGAKLYFQNLAIQTAGQVLTESINFAEYFWDEQLRLTDDYIGQREKRIAKQYVNRVANAGSSILSSTLTGAASAGWVGALVGFTVSLGNEIFKTVSDNFIGERTQNITIKQMEAQLDFTRNRAGWSTQAASIGEDL